jgi:hypothetical protein
MFGFGKGFVIFLFISILIGAGTKSWENFFVLILSFISVKIIWKLLT